MDGVKRSCGILSVFRGRLRLKCDGTRAETRFRLSAKQTNPFRSAGDQFTRLLAGELCTSACRGLYCSCKSVFCSHVTLTGYQLHSLVSPSLSCASPCASHFKRSLHQVTLFDCYSDASESVTWFTKERSLNIGLMETKENYECNVWCVQYVVNP